MSAKNKRKDSSTKTSSQDTADDSNNNNNNDSMTDKTDAFTGTLTPYLSIQGCMDAIEWYKKAFNAESLGVYPDKADEKKVMHATLKIYGNNVFMSDDFDFGGPSKVWKNPLSAKASTVALHVEFKSNIQQAWDHAVKNGAKAIMPLELQFWGDIYGQLQDPYGHVWSFSTTPKKR